MGSPLIQRPSLLPLYPAALTLGYTADGLSVSPLTLVAFICPSDPSQHINAIKQIRQQTAEAAYLQK